jgi:hypothetical protein
MTLRRLETVAQYTLLPTSARTRALADSKAFCKRTMVVR